MKDEIEQNTLFKIPNINKGILRQSRCGHPC
jgi:hypothetical protein